MRSWDRRIAENSLANLDTESQPASYFFLIIYLFTFIFLEFLYCFILLTWNSVSSNASIRLSLFLRGLELLILLPWVLPPFQVLRLPAWATGSDPFIVFQVRVLNHSPECPSFVPFLPVPPEGWLQAHPVSVCSFSLFSLSFSLLMYSFCSLLAHY